jgi:hypothetical protein
VLDYKLGPMTAAQGYDGKRAWSKEQSGTVAYQDGGDARALTINTAYRDANLWWRPGFDGASIKYAGTRPGRGGATFDVLLVTPKGGAPFEAWFDTATHLLTLVSEKRDGVFNVVTYVDYSAENGVKLAHHMLTTTGDPQFDTLLTLTHAAFTSALPDSAFAIPKETLDASIVGGAHQTTIPIQLIGNHIYGNAMVDGKGPFLFVFDTGGVNLLTPTVTRQLGLTSEGKIEGTGAGAATVQSGLTKVQDLRIGDASIRGKTFYVFALEKLYDAGGVNMLGMAGYETFRRFVTRIDYGAQTLTLIDPEYFDPKDAGTPVKIAFNDNVVLVKGSFAGIPGTFQIDTGSGGDLTLNTSFVDAHNLRAKFPHGMNVIGGYGVGGPSYEFETRGRDLTMGAVTIAHPVVGFSTDKKGAFANPTISGNIGSAALKRFIVTFDYGHGVMYLKPTAHPMNDLDTFDRAGAWINLDPQGFKIVDVDKGGPAQQAGLKASDIITAVDGKPAKDITLPELRLRLRDDAPGTVVRFTLKDGRTTRVTLRDLI